jgi:hypothetical protein
LIVASTKGWTRITLAANTMGQDAVKIRALAVDDHPLLRKDMRRRLMCGVALLLAGASVALAQTATGVIRGRVQDTTGAVITDALVRLIDERRNQNWDQRTNGEGFFEFRALPFGDYRVELEHPGFKKQVVRELGLEVAQSQTLDVTLQVGSLAESIDVQADRGVLEASDASLSQVIDGTPLLALPTNGRNVMQLVSLSAASEPPPPRNRTPR